MLREAGSYQETRYSAVERIHFCFRFRNPEEPEIMFKKCPEKMSDQNEI